MMKGVLEMKKVLAYLLVIVSLVSAGDMLVYAEPAEGQKPILDVIRDQGDYSPTDNIFNKENYDETMEGFDLTEDLLLKVALLPAFSSVGMDYDEQFVYAKKCFALLHVAFRDEIYTFQETRNGIITRKNTMASSNAALYYNYEIKKPKFIQDILNSDIYNSELHLPDTEYSRVVCFAAQHSQEATCVYYVGDNRTIVRCYEYYSAEGVDILLDDFVVYAKVYDEMTRKNGHLNGGGSFLHFVDNYTVAEAKEYYETAKAERLEKENQTEGEGANVLVWIIPTAAAVVLLGGAIAFIALRKKKTKS